MLGPATSKAETVRDIIGPPSSHEEQIACVALMIPRIKKYSLFGKLGLPYIVRAKSGFFEWSRYRCRYRTVDSDKTAMYTRLASMESMFRNIRKPPLFKKRGGFLCSYLVATHTVANLSKQKNLFTRTRSSSLLFLLKLRPKTYREEDYKRNNREIND